MFYGILVMGGLGIFVGVGLALASKLFYVYVDPKIEATEEALPGANCGGCGYPGCSANAVAIVEGKSPPSSCVAAGPETAEKIAEIMGVKIEAREPDIAKPGCTYGLQDADLKYIYSGVRDCRAAVLLDGGTKLCPIGCLGLGTCVRACPFGALSMGPDNLPVVDPELCTGCGTCERICPKNIITLSSYTRRIQLEHTTEECTAPCQRACPAGIDIPSYIREISAGRYLEAVRIIKETNPFPLVCGRICVHPCELVCRRNLVDEPIAINHLKRFAADYEMNSGQRVHNPRAPETGRRVAVIGGGAEGLTAAYMLNRLGHDSTVFEASDQLGGLLRTGLPENRLPKPVLDWEIEGILDAGVEARTQHKLGKDITIASLLEEGYEAVFVATGGWDAHLADRSRGKTTNPLPGIQRLIDFIMSQRAGRKPSAGKHIMILGGGNAAFEAAASCLEEGAASITLTFRTSRDRCRLSEDELKSAEEQGLRLLFNTAVTGMIGEADRLIHVEIVHLNARGEEQGERKLVAVETLLTGTGRFPELIYVPQKKEDQEDQGPLKDPVAWKTLFPYASPFAEDDIGIFRPGEVTSDYKAVVEAIGSGRRAASSVQHYFSEEALEAPHNMIRTHTRVLSLDQLEPVPKGPRQKMPMRSHEEQIRDPSAEIALGYTEDQAREEAKRCLQCGLICYRRVKTGMLH